MPLGVNKPCRHCGRPFGRQSRGTRGALWMAPISLWPSACPRIPRRLTRKWPGMCAPVTTLLRVSAALIGLISSTSGSIGAASKLSVVGGFSLFRITMCKRDTGFFGMLQRTTETIETIEVTMEAPAKAPAEASAEAPVEAPAEATTEAPAAIKRQNNQQKKRRKKKSYH